MKISKICQPNNCSCGEKATVTIQDGFTTWMCRWCAIDYARSRNQGREVEDRIIDLSAEAEKQQFQAAAAAKRKAKEVFYKNSMIDRHPMERYQGEFDEMDRRFQEAADDPVHYTDHRLWEKNDSRLGSILLHILSRWEKRGFETPYVVSMVSRRKGRPGGPIQTRCQVARAVAEDGTEMFDIRPLEGEVGGDVRTVGKAALREGLVLFSRIARRQHGERAAAEAAAAPPSRILQGWGISA